MGSAEVLTGILSAILGITVLIVTFVAFLDRRMNTRILKGFEHHDKETDHHRPAECPNKAILDGVISGCAAHRSRLEILDRADLPGRLARTENDAEHLERRVMTLEDRVASLDGTGTRRRR